MSSFVLMKQRSFSVLGSLVVVNFQGKISEIEKKKFAKEILDKNKNIKTVVEKSKKFSGRLRKMKTKFLAGEKTKEVLYKENGCVFRFNIDSTYFSPRLSNERKELAKKINSGKVFVAFAGVAPFSIIIAKNSKVRKVFSNEINREANKYAKLNVELNKLKNKVEIVAGDFKKIAEKFKKQRIKFDAIVMPRPQLKDTFLDDAFKISKKGTKIFYYDFCKTKEIKNIVEKIKSEAKKSKKKIKILQIKQAGEIAPYKIRCRVEFVVK